LPTLIRDRATFARRRHSGVNADLVFAGRFFPTRVGQALSREKISSQNDDMV
jgi:hypothetical protein